MQRVATATMLAVTTVGVLQVEVAVAGGTLGILAAAMGTATAVPH